MTSTCQTCGRLLNDPTEFHPFEMCILFDAGQTRETIWDFIQRAQAYLGPKRGQFRALRDVAVSAKGTDA